MVTNLFATFNQNRDYEASAVEYSVNNVNYSLHIVLLMLVIT